MKPKSSPIWNYYLEVSSCAALCKSCNREYSRKGRTTSALKSHLKAMHPQLFDEFQQLDDAMKNGLLTKSNNVAPYPNVVQQIRKKIQEQKKAPNVQLSNKESFTLEHKNAILSRDILMPDIKTEFSNTQIWIEESDQVSDTQTWTPEIKIELQNDVMENDFKNEHEWFTDRGTPNQEKWTQANEEVAAHDDSGDMGHKRIWINDNKCDIPERRKTNELNVFRECSNEKSQEMNRLIGEMIAEQGLRLDFVESIGFRRVMNAALPSYKLSGSEFFTTYICDDLYHGVRNNITNVLRKLKTMTFTVDIVKLHYSKSLLIITAYGIDEEFHRKSMVLRCDVLGEYTQQEISLKFQRMLQEWDIEYQRVHCVIHDQGIMRTNELYSNISCVIHQVQRSVDDVMQSEEWFQQLLKKLMDITKHFEHSASAQEELKSIQTEKLNLSFVPPLLEVPTRWNTWYSTMERFIKIKDALSLYLDSVKIAIISSEDWSNIDKCTKLYKPLKEFTAELMKSNNNISSVLPLVQVLKNALENEKSVIESSERFNKVINKLSGELNLILNNLKTDTQYTIATYLDPRYKTIFFKDIVLNEVETATIEIINKAHQIGQSSSNTKMNTETEVKNKNDEKDSQLKIMLESFLSANDFEVEQIKDDKVKIMLDNYKKEIRLPLTEDPLMWWKNNGGKYSLLLSSVRIYLQPPASSVCKLKEETISDIKLTRIHDQNSRKLLFLKYNMPLLNFEY